MLEPRRAARAGRTPDNRPFLKNGQISENLDGRQKLFEAPRRDTSKSKAKMRGNFFLGPDTNLKIVDFKDPTIVRGPGSGLN